MENGGLGILIIVVWTIIYLVGISRLYANKSNDQSNLLKKQEVVMSKFLILGNFALGGYFGLYVDRIKSLKS